jgi:exodeoxyribonuclease VII small subunit
MMKQVEQMKEDIKFGKAIDKLDEIIVRLEEGVEDLDEIVELFTEGSELIKLCNQKLFEVESKIEMISQNLNKKTQNNE